MSENPLTVEVASPCVERWDDMPGDERVRKCGRCNLHVYNLSAMRAGEARAVVSRAEGRVCVRFFQRADGTVMTADCPVRRLKPSRRYMAAWTAAVVGVGFAAVLKLDAPQRPADVSPVSQINFPEWAKRPLPKHQEFRPKLEFVPRRETIMGGLRSQRFPSTQ